MALQFTDPKPYFAKPLALKNLLGEKAYNDFKLLMDPCCGIGIDKICTAPCGETAMCPTILITAVNLDCQNGNCNAAIVVANASGPISGFIQMQISLLIFVGYTIAFQVDSFTVPGNGTFVVPLTNTCGLLGTIDNIPFGFASFFAYSVSEISSNLFPLTQAVFNCPTIQDCGQDSKNCPQVDCILGIRTLTLQPVLTENGGTFTGPFYLQTAPETSFPYTWTTVGTLSPTPVIGTNVCTVDITALSIGTYSYRIIDSSVPPVSSYVHFIDPFGGKTDAPQFNITSPCDPIIPGNITNLAVTAGCTIGGSDLNVAFDFTAAADTYQVEVFDSGIWHFLFAIGYLAGPGTYNQFGLSPLGYGPLNGDYLVRVMDLTSGLASSEVKVTFPDCAVPVINFTNSNLYCADAFVQNIQTTFDWANLGSVNDFQIQYEAFPGMWSTIVIIGDEGVSSGGPLSSDRLVSPLVPAGTYNVRIIDTETGVISNSILTTFTNC